MINKVESLLEFGTFRLDPVQRQLFSNDQPIPLSPKAFDTLLVLVEASGRIVEKEEFLRRIWPDTFVEEGSLARNISIVRKGLGENPDDQKYIQTIPKRGYRFVAPVTAIAAASQSVLNEEHSRSQAALDDDSTTVGTGQREAAGSLAQSASRLWTPNAMAGAAVTVLAVACILAWRADLGGIRSWIHGGVNPPIQSIAVLPLQNLSRDPEQEYFADGVTDSLITSLAQIRALKVISRTSIMRYKGTAKSVPEIARELGVDAILEGSVQRDGNRVRISAQLIQAATDKHLWAQSYERDLSNILQLEGELATVVAGEVKVQVETETRKRLNRAPRVASAAQEEYLLACHQRDIRDEAHLKQAIQHFEAAIQLEPEFAAAYAGLAQAWVQRGVLGASGFRESEVPARSAAIRALELDSHLAEAHEALAHILMFYDMAWVTAEQEFHRAIELNSSNVDAHVYYATLLEILGRFPEAIAEGQRSLELDPVSVTVTSEYGRVLFRARKYDEAIRQFQRALELDPQDKVTRFRLADVYVQTGRFQEALSLLPTTPAQAARAYALLGRREEARTILTKVADPNKARLDFALAYFALGDRARGFELLTRAFDDRRYVNLIGCDPRWDIVRDDPRFRALVRRLCLPDVLPSR